MNNVTVPLLSGRGLWYGTTDQNKRDLVFDEQSWKVECQKAVLWGIHVVHPKVADGGILWYDTPGLQMLKRVADDFDLICAPYHVCNGNLFGLLSMEAQFCAKLGAYFGAICPVMLSNWEIPEAKEWALEFFHIVRNEYLGPVYPVTFSNPEQHPNIPWRQLSSWVTAIMPQVYFSGWAPPTAENALSYVKPQWDNMDQLSKKNGGIGFVPMLPIISLEHGVAPSEIAAWLGKAQGYGYCGFWQNDNYMMYAQAILSAPEPQRSMASSYADTATTTGSLPVTGQIKSPFPSFPTAPPTNPSHVVPIISMLSDTPPAAAPAATVDVSSTPTVVRESGSGSFKMNVPVVLEPSSAVRPLSATLSQSTLTTPDAIHVALSPGDSGELEPVSIASSNATLTMPTSPSLAITDVPIQQEPFPDESVSMAPTIYEHPAIKMDDVPPPYFSIDLDAINISTALSMNQLQVLWQSLDPSINWNPESPITQVWISIVRQWDRHGILIGAPTRPEARVQANGEDFSYLVCDSGRKIVFFHGSQTVALF